MKKKIKIQLTGFSNSVGRIYGRNSVISIISFLGLDCFTRVSKNRVFQYFQQSMDIYQTTLFK